MVTDSVRSDIALLHRRLAFGALPPDLDAAAAAGYDAAVSALIGTLGAATPHADAVPRPTLTAAATLRAEKQAGAKGGGARRNEAASIARWWIARMVSTEAPAQERLLWFWHGHFATSVRKVKAPSLVFAQLDAERAASAGPFRDLAAAAIKCPAMLIWLDQAKSTKGHPNENLAREALELFTMGRNRGYAEDDVKAAARALTGWTLDADVAFTVRPATHDPGPETLLARTGSLTGDDLLDLATQHPSTATHLAWKAWTAFAGPVA